LQPGFFVAETQRGHIAVIKFLPAQSPGAAQC